MKIKLINNCLKVALACCVILSIINFLSYRSLWHDEAALALNIVNKSIFELFEPLEYNQVAPIGFLVFQKGISWIFGYTDWSLRIFPMLSFFISIIAFFKLSKELFLEKSLALFCTLFFVSSQIILSYSNEVKPYISDLTITLIIILTTLTLTKRNDQKLFWQYALIGLISIWFSNTAVIVLFSSGIYLIFKFWNSGRKKLFKLPFVFSIWLVSFGIYYVFFIHNHPTEEYMHSFWSKVRGGFLPYNIFSFEFYSILKYKAFLFFNMLGNTWYIIIVIPFFIIGIFNLFKNNKDYFFLLLLPIITHLFLTYLKIYPFDTRLTLYLFPCLVLVMISGITYMVKKIKYRWHILGIFIVFNSIVLGLKGFPVQKEELKDALGFMESKVQQNDIIYVHHAANEAFLFYEKNYEITAVHNRSNIIIAESQGKNWINHNKTIKNLKGNIWAVFSHVYGKNKDGLNEKEYILEVFKNNNFKVLEEKKFVGASAYNLSKK